MQIRSKFLSACYVFCLIGFLFIPNSARATCLYPPSTIVGKTPYYDTTCINASFNQTYAAATGKQWTVDPYSCDGSCIGPGFRILCNGQDCTRYTAGHN